MNLKLKVKNIDLKNDKLNMNQPINLTDYRAIARKVLQKEIFDFIDGGACDEITKYRNRRSFNEITIKPLCLRDVSDVDPSIKLMGNNLRFPALIGPTAFHQLIQQAGEIATARAAKLCSIPMIVSTMSNHSLEEIASQSLHNNLWLQTYIFKNRELTESLIRRAEKAGYKAIVITVGSPQMGKRDRDIRNSFVLPSELTTGNFESPKANINNMLIYKFAESELDPSATWDDIRWVQSLTKLPILLKGIMNILDAEKACRLNLAGIIVSNHGGRQLDTTEATISVLPAIVKTVNSRILVMMDSGIRRGTDVFKAIALGADAILLGRPILWALAASGESGVVKALDILKEEFEISLKLSGCCNIQEIRKYSPNIINNNKVSS